MTSSYLQWDGAKLDPGESWQGIHYLDLEIPDPDGTSKAKLTVHLNQPAAGLLAEDVRVLGGERIKDLKPEVEVDGHRIVLRFPQLGDHSTYYVELRRGGNLRLHPFFAVASFTFTLGCDLGDCRERALPAAAPRRGPPVVDLLTKDFNGFVGVMAERIRSTNPAWGDLSPASLERVLVDLLAHQGDMLSYYQDRVANEAFVETATQRRSLREHGALLGYRIFDGLAARTLLSVDPANAGYVPEGLSARIPGRPGEPPVVFATTERVWVDPTNNSDKLIPAAWPEAFDAQIPCGATEMLLWGQDVALRPGDRLALVQGRFSQVVTIAATELTSLPGWVGTPEETNPPSTSELTRVVWREPLERDLSPWTGDDFELHANLVEARHGEFTRARLSAQEDPKLGRDEVLIRLDRRNHTAVRVARGQEPVVHLRALLVPEGPVVFHGDGDESREPALRLRIDGELWERVEHLGASEPHQLHYTATADNDGRLWLGFGDGVRGREIELDRATGRPKVELEISYRTGDAVAGNCDLYTLTELVGVQPETAQARNEYAALGQITKEIRGKTYGVVNVVPGSGGRAPASLDAVRQQIPRSIRHGELRRAVSLEDYAELARTVPGVARAAATNLGGVFNTVLILVDPEGQAELDELDEDLRRAVWERIDETRMAGREHLVRGPIYVPIEVELWVCPQPGWQRYAVRDLVLRELRPGTDERPGYFHPDRLTFGDDLELGDLLALVQGLPGVRSVKARVFRRLDQAETQTEPLDRITTAPIEVLRLDGDDNFPEHGQLRVKVVGLDELDLEKFRHESAPSTTGGCS